MIIEKCVVKVNSEEELRQVEDVCFKHKIGFYDGDFETRDEDRFDNELYNCVYIEDNMFCTHRISEYDGLKEDGAIYNFKPFMAKYSKKKKETKIPDCNIKVASKEEHEMVQKICFKHGVVWCFSGESIQNYHINNIYIKDNTMCNDSYVDGILYTFQQFCDKYDKPTTTKKYRIKTEQEFIEEFGEDFRYAGSFTYQISNDHLFGREFTDEENTKYINGSIMCIGGWGILTREITEIKDKESIFNPKKYAGYLSMALNNAFCVAGKHTFDGTESTYGTDPKPTRISLSEHLGLTKPKKEFKLNDSLFSRRKLITVDQDN